MNFLIISDTETFSKVISAEIKKVDSKSKIFESDFTFEALKKNKKHFDDISLCLIFAENLNNISEETISLLSMSAGFIIASDIPVLSNIKILTGNDLLGKKSIEYVASKNECINYIQKQYKSISKKNLMRQSKKSLLSKGIPFTPDCFALYIAKEKMEICNLFINAGIDINSRDDSGTPMINIAVRNDNIDLVKDFIELGADINCVSDDRGYTPVMDAVWRGNEKITELLISKGAELNTINKEGQTNLVLAVGADRIEICKLLVENGANPDVADSMGMSAYGYASLFRKTEILDILSPYHKE